MAKATLVLAYDLGGTKVAVGVVDARGNVIADIKTPVVKARSPGPLLAQLAELGRPFLKRYPEIRHVGIASAGPLHAADGLLLYPVNLAAPRPLKSWNRVPITAKLSQALDRPVTLENDAAAAVLAEVWKGVAKGFENVVILTLGTGLGVGVIANGSLVRGGRGLHPEGGHLTLNATDLTAPCGCGNPGCAEAYLSGNGFSRHFALRFETSKARTKTRRSAAEIAELARQKKNPTALAAFDEYATMMATAIHSYVVLYSPEIVVLTGSFAAAADLFLPAVKLRLKKLLSTRRSGIDLLPKIMISALDNRAGLLGGARLALEKLGQIRR